MSVRVCPAASGHLAEVAAIYAEAARTSVSTFDLDGLPLEHWQAKLDHQAPGDHFLVAVGEDGGVLGLAYSGPFRPRPAYARTRETSIYLRADARGQGLGRLLYSRLLALLSEAGMHLAVAAVAEPNPASEALHLALGFTKVGTFEEVGFKFASYVSTTWFQLPLA